MHTADGALKLVGRCGEVPVKSTMPVRVLWSIDTFTRMTLPSSIS